MALTRQQKEQRVSLLTEKLKKAESVAIVRIGGKSVKDVAALRSRLKASGAEKVVAKKTLLRIASRRAGLPELSEESLQGSIAVVLSYADPVAGPKVMSDFQKQKGGSEFLGGYLGVAVASPSRIAELASMLGRKECCAAIAAMFKAPLLSFASACASTLPRFARGIQELARSRQPS
jgi:large subunit ribosomal protein L10